MPQDLNIQSWWFEFTLKPTRVPNCGHRGTGIFPLYWITCSSLYSSALAKNYIWWTPCTSRFLILVFASKWEQFLSKLRHLNDAQNPVLISLSANFLRGAYNWWNWKCSGLRSLRYENVAIRSVAQLFASCNFPVPTSYCLKIYFSQSHLLNLD